MKKIVLFLFSCLSFFISCKSSYSKAELLNENNVLKERISKLETNDSLNLEAAIELKKMNVVYRGVSNPIYISKPKAISFEASAPGLKKVDNLGNYVLSTGLGNTVDIIIQSKLKNGNSLTEIKTLRIRDIGRPYGTINNFGCNFNCELKFTKEELTDAMIGAKVNDLLHNMDFIVSSFKLKMPHYRTLEIEGNKMNIWANDLFTLLRPNDKIQIFDIKVRILGVNSYRLKGVIPISIEVIE